MDSPGIQLESIFTQCNEHLREMDKNRDRLIEFYLVLVAALLTAITTVRLEASAASALTLLVFLLGCVLAHTVTQYRLWHTRYSHTATLLQAFMKSKDPRETERQVRQLAFRDLGIISQLGADERGWSRWFKYDICRVPGTEFATFQASLLITAIPLFLLLGRTPLYPWLPFFIVILYIAAANLCAAWYLYRRHRECPWATWLLNGLDLEWDFGNEAEIRWPRHGRTHKA